MNTEDIMIITDKAGRFLQVGFEWEKGCANDYFTKFCKASGIRFEYRHQKLHADWNRDGNLIPLTYQHLFGSMFMIVPEGSGK